MGSGAVFMGREVPPVETITDINEYAIEFFKNIKTHPEKFWDLLNQHLSNLYSEGVDNIDHGRKCFNEWKLGVVHKDTDPVERSVFFYLITKNAMNGIWRKNKKGECNSSYCKVLTGRGIMTREWFDIVRERIKHTNFQHMDFRTSLKYASQCSSTFVFLDPPYRLKTIENGRGCVTTYNAKKFTDQDHQDLNTVLLQAQYNWLLTINDDDWIREIYKECYIVPHEVFYSCSQTSNGRGRRPELLIANYDISKVQLDLDAAAKNTKHKSISGVMDSLPNSGRKS